MITNATVQTERTETQEIYKIIKPQLNSLKWLGSLKFTLKMFNYIFTQSVDFYKCIETGNVLSLPQEIYMSQLNMVHYFLLPTTCIHSHGVYSLSQSREIKNQQSSIKHIGLNIESK